MAVRATATRETPRQPRAHEAAAPEAAAPEATQVRAALRRRRITPTGVAHRTRRNSSLGSTNRT